VPSRSFAEGPALKLHGIGGRYATALYTVATKKQCFIVGSELESLTALRASTPAFERLISDPTIQDSVKLPALNAIMDKGGFSAPLKKFFGAYVTNNTEHVRGALVVVTRGRRCAMTQACWWRTSAWAIWTRLRRTTPSCWRRSATSSWRRSPQPLCVLRVLAWRRAAEATGDRAGERGGTRR
jgi:hypothetical protein